MKKITYIILSAHAITNFKLALNTVRLLVIGAILAFDLTLFQLIFYSMIIRLFGVFLLLFLASAMSAQKPKTNDQLQELAFQMVNDSVVENRVEASQLLKAELLKSLASKGSFNNDFEELSSISIADSRDGVFRIFSWQLYKSPDAYEHEAIIQFYDKEKDLVILDDQSDDIRYPDQKELSVNRWFGALYYNIIPFKVKGKMKYLLFGFDGATSTENCKIADILNIDKKGNISFGAPMFETVFQDVKRTSYRHFHQYDQNAKAVLNYDAEQEIIIYDNLIPWTSKEFGVGLTYVPDGSYQGFKLKKSKWLQIQKVYDYVSEVPVTAENPFGKKQKTNQK